MHVFARFNTVQRLVDNATDRRQPEPLHGFRDRRGGIRDVEGSTGTLLNLQSNRQAAKGVQDDHRGFAMTQPIDPPHITPLDKAAQLVF